MTAFQVDLGAATHAVPGVSRLSQCKPAELRWPWGCGRARRFHGYAAVQRSGCPNSWQLEPLSHQGDETDDYRHPASATA